MLMFLGQAFSSCFELKLYAIGRKGGIFLVCALKRDVDRTCRRESHSVFEENHFLFTRSVEPPAACKDNLPLCQYEWGTGQLLEAGLNKDDLQQTMSYHTSLIYLTGYPSATYDVSGTRGLYFLETIFDIERPVRDSEWLPMVQTEQKPVAEMQHILRTFIRPVAMFLVTCMDKRGQTMLVS